VTAGREPAIRHADPVAKRRAMMLIVGVGCGGALLIAVAGHYRDALRDWIMADPEAAAGRIDTLLHWTIVVTVAPLFAFGVYALRLGARVTRDRLFPPPGQRVVRDTPIVSGRAALARGARLKWIGAVAIGAAMLLGIALWHWIRWQ
jgi:hypothetical protein